MEYRACLVSKPIWYAETKITAKYLCQGYDKDSLRKIVIDDNIYETHAEYRAIEILNTVTLRLSRLPKELISEIAFGDVVQSKILVLISVLMSDRLFFEFMYDVFQDKITIGDLIISNRDLDDFFENKKHQSEAVEKWTPRTIQKLRQAYMRILCDTNLISSSVPPRKITVPLISPENVNILKANHLDAYLLAIGVDS